MKTVFSVGFALLFNLSVWAGDQSTYLLVHGALFTGDGWARTVSELQNSGESVVTLNVPGRARDGIDPKNVDLKLAVEKVCRVARTISGQVILVGHSQGGALITEATAVCPEKIKALVYVAAVVPLNGETAFTGLNATTQANFGRCVTPDPDNKLFRLVTDKNVLENAFFQDVRAQDEKLADLALASMVDEPLLIGNLPLSFPQKFYDRLPKFYVKTLQDQVVDPSNQDEYIAKVRMTKVFSMNASHSPFLSRPKELAANLTVIGKMLKSAQQATSENIEIVKTFYRALGNGDMKLLSNVLADDIVWHQPGNGKLSGVYSGKDQVFALFGRFMEISKGSFKIDSVNNVMANGNFVTATLHFSASNDQDSIAMSGVDLMKVTAGKITEVWLFSEDQAAEDRFWK